MFKLNSNKTKPNSIWKSVYCAVALGALTAPTRLPAKSNQLEQRERLVASKAPVRNLDAEMPKLDWSKISAFYTSQTNVLYIFNMRKFSSAVKSNLVPVKLLKNNKASIHLPSPFQVGRKEMRDVLCEVISDEPFAETPAGKTSTNVINLAFGDTYHLSTTHMRLSGLQTAPYPEERKEHPGATSTRYAYREITIALEGGNEWFAQCLVDNAKVYFYSDAAGTKFVGSTIAGSTWVVSAGGYPDPK